VDPTARPQAKISSASSSSQTVLGTSPRWSDVVQSLGDTSSPRSWDVSGMACQQVVADPQELLIDGNCAGSGGLGPFPA
jgi:hypothetical protein